MENKIDPHSLQVPGKLPEKKKRPLLHKIISITVQVLGILVVLAIVAGGALLAGHVWNPRWNPFKPSPTDKIIQERYFKKNGIDLP